MAGKGRNHGEAFKAKMALAALKGDKPPGELAAQLGADVKALHAKIGQLSMENVLCAARSGE